MLNATGISKAKFPFGRKQTAPPCYGKAVAIGRDRMLDLDEATKNELLLDYVQCVQNVRSELFKFVVPGSKAPTKER